ncbi:MAG: hypothetical protein Q4G69_00620 [Planctomycetia bacterium]|nr:hypothetical protein [Planctomycetia bacterium]
MKPILRMYHCLGQILSMIFSILGQVNPFGFFCRHWILSLLLLGILINGFAFFWDPNKNFSVQMAQWTWYLDWRFWPEWMSRICWLMPIWASILVLIPFLFPANHRRFFMRPRFYQILAVIGLAIVIDSIWRSETKTPFSIYGSLALKFYQNYSHILLPILGALIALVLALSLYKMRKRRIRSRLNSAKTGGIILLLLLIGSPLNPILSQTKTPAPPVHPSENKTVKIDPQKKIQKSANQSQTISKSQVNPKPANPVKTLTPKPVPVYKYKIQSREELERLTVKQIWELVAEENRFERRGDKLQLNGPMVHLFEEKDFLFSGGKYENATIKYRLFSPLKTTPDKKYPLVIYLHGIGESGNDNAYPLLYLNNLLPIMIGPDKEDFYMLVLQCPRKTPGWRFRTTRDGTLDVLNTLVDKLVQELPIDPGQLSLFGLSSGGHGVWLYAQQYPEKFAAACPAPGTPLNMYSNLRKMIHTRIWSFRGTNDKANPAEPILKIADFLNASGGYAKLTEIEKGGHGVWMPAMRKYDCFRWMIKQKRNSWFAPLPERMSFKTWSVSESWQKFLMPLTIALCLLLVSGMPLFQSGREYFQRKMLCYAPPKTDEDDQSNREEPEEGQTDETHSDETNQSVCSDDAREDQTEETSSSCSESVPTETKEDQGTGSDDDPYRIWTNASGSKNIQARVVGFENEMVIIELPDGKRMKAKFQIFSKEDVAYLQEKRKQYKDNQEG